ncbi:uncharacterized protein L969DRAFT_72218 [Mixia osmundae IAM 14324]|uniref:proline--tRNA ligase n=1 Tax=Mixia osmundae (strain CBS 9802 / IAM 14324 / JCM 22182 / KY 12970) TaxID=764103 RepID=G7E5G0_MIXOS|nr:uncharacterized protein L969DRAFT_72218 [Mixia osmundae IAM 14324]KEI40779.1 hypothetical protein L969DRAFT_72218 [Mixia osmundae IAM 14324]GAA98070.1 hypothetical protein E5Q_04752 [Mixia osmundae IAM 14324]
MQCAPVRRQTSAILCSACSALVPAHPSLLARRIWHARSDQRTRASSSATTAFPAGVRISRNSSAHLSGAIRRSEAALLTPGTRALIEQGYIAQSASGLWTLLTPALRILQKIERIIDEEMIALGADKVAMPALLKQSLWQRSGRYKPGATNRELLQVHDRKGQHWILGPTHEEEITELVGQRTLTHKSLPLRYYQIGRKYRDEARPRGGLLRSKEFVMKDLYSFDSSVESATITYEAVLGAYKRIFDRLDLTRHGIVMARADSGEIGGSLSHEWHLLHASGEDDVQLCSACQYAANVEFGDKDAGQSECPSCGSGRLTTERAIEVGHTFFLGTRYSEPLGLKFHDADNTQKHVQMGCYGIGTTRLLGVMAELYLKDQRFVWPKHLAPFSLAVLPVNNELDDLTATLLHRYHALGQGRVDKNDIVVNRDYQTDLRKRTAQTAVLGSPTTLIVRDCDADRLDMSVVRSDGVVEVRARSANEIDAALLDLVNAV